MMKRLVSFTLIASLSVLTAPAQKSSEYLMSTETLKQISLDMAQAMKARDADGLSQILADDWTAFGFGEDKLVTKQKVVGDLKSGRYTLKTFTLGPMYVKLLGDVGVVQGVVNETWVYDGQQGAGKYVWMDVFAKRDNKWVIVRSQSAGVS
jgi:ketosteroid isomerase-like protein